MRKELIFSSAKAGKPYEATYMGTNHLVVPVVMLVEGVVTPGNIGKPELVLESEFSKLPESWNGRPVVLDHPTDDTANTPFNLENTSFGLLFNTSSEKKKLKSEAWINLDRVEELGGEIQVLVDDIKDGKTIEVSTGLYSMTEQKDGNFNGQDFEGIWRNIVPDHLAFLSSGDRGSCNIDMGCGANRTNKAAEMKCKKNCEAGKCNCVKVRKLLEPKIDKFVAAMLKGGELNYVENASISDTDLRASLAATLDDYMENNNTDGYYYYYIIAVFSDIVVWGSFSGLSACAYSVNDAGDTALTGDPYEVRPMTQFVPVKPFDSSSENAPAAKMASKSNGALNSSEDHAMTEQEKAAAELTAKQNAAAERTKEINDAVALALNKRDEELKAKAPKNADEAIAAMPEHLREVFSDGLRLLKNRKDALVKLLEAHKSKIYSKEELEAMPVEQLEKIAKIANVASDESVDFSGRGAPVALANRNVEDSLTDDDGAPDPLKVFNYNDTNTNGVSKKTKEEEAAQAK